MAAHVWRHGKSPPPAQPGSRGKVAGGGEGHGECVRPAWDGGGPRVTGVIFWPLDPLPFPLLCSLPVGRAASQTSNVASISTSCLPLQL